jgi:hypothetical protein
MAGRFSERAVAQLLTRFIALTQVSLRQQSPSWSQDSLPYQKILRDSSRPAGHKIHYSTRRFSERAVAQLLTRFVALTQVSLREQSLSSSQDSLLYQKFLWESSRSAPHKIHCSTRSFSERAVADLLARFIALPEDSLREQSLSSSQDSLLYQKFLWESSRPAGHKIHCSTRSFSERAVAQLVTRFIALPEVSLREQSLISSQDSLLYQKFLWESSRWSPRKIHCSTRSFSERAVAQLLTRFIALTQVSVRQQSPSSSHDSLL